MSYNVPQPLLDILQSGAIPTNFKVVNNNPGGEGPGSTPDGSWANPYLTIQDAMDSMTAPNPGDPSTWYEFLWIMGGDYPEDVTITQAKIISIFTLGIVRIGDQSGGVNDLTWNMVAPVGVPAVLSVLPMPLVASTNVSFFEVTGDFIIDGDSSSRSISLQNTKVTGSLKGKDAELPGAWTGTIILSTLNCTFDGPDPSLGSSGGPSIAFADGTTYQMAIEDSVVNHGVFCESAGGGIGAAFINSTVNVGDFTPAGDPTETASVWLPGAFCQMTDTTFDDAVEVAFSSAKGCTFGGDATIGISDLRECALTANGIFDTCTMIDTTVAQALTVSTSTGSIRRCEIVGASSLGDTTLLENSVFQSTLTTSDGAVIVSSCQINGNTILARLGQMSDCRINGDFTVTANTGIPNDIVTGTIISGTVSLGTPASTRIDIATNSLCSFPSGTLVLNNSTSPVP